MSRQGIRANEFIQVLNPGETAVAVQNYPTSGSYIDVSQYRRFAFKIFVGALDSSLTFQVKQDTSATQTASITNITGATVTVDATTGDNGTFVIEVDQSQLAVGAAGTDGFKYVTLAASGASGSNDYATIVFEGRLPKEVPVTQPAAFPAANYVLLG